MKEEKMKTTDRPDETVEEIVADMRRGTKILGYWRSCDLNEILQYNADRLEAAYKRENHCEKRYDKDGDEMPPHCAFDDLKIDRLQAKVDDLKAELERVRIGNAAMREALERIIDLEREMQDSINRKGYSAGGEAGHYFYRAVQVSRSALTP